MRYLVLILLTGCVSVPYGNWNPEAFRREYDTLGDVVNNPHSLRSIQFQVYPTWEDFRLDVCDTCDALHKRIDGTHVIFLPPVKDPCDKPNGRPTMVYGRLVMHELLHASHYMHETKEEKTQFEELLDTAWDLYKEKYCGNSGTD